MIATGCISLLYEPETYKPVACGFVTMLQCYAGLNLTTVLYNRIIVERPDLYFGNAPCVAFSNLKPFRPLTFSTSDVTEISSRDSNWDFKIALLSLAYVNSTNCSNTLLFMGDEVLEGSYELSRRVCQWYGGESIRSTHDTICDVNPFFWIPFCICTTQNGPGDVLRKELDPQDYLDNETLVSSPRSPLKC